MGAPVALDLPQIPTYRLERAIYRRGDLEHPLLYRGLWGPGGRSPEALSQPLRRAITLRFYDRAGTLVRVLSTNAQRGYLTALSWEITNQGCGLCNLTSTEDLSLSFDYRVSVHLWNQSSPVYSGYMLRDPATGGTDRVFSYEFQGGRQLLDRVYVTATYGAQSVLAIVLDQLRAAGQRLPIAFNEAKIDTIAYSTVGDLKFLRMPLSKVLSQLADLAGGYEWGVDEDAEFFFRAKSEDVDMHTWVGKHLQTYTPGADYSEICNRLFIKTGKVRSDLAATDPYYKTNWLPDAVEDAGPGSSQDVYGLREGEYSAPSVLNLVDALVAGQVELNRRKGPRRFASVAGLTYEGTPFSVTGQARIVGRDGSELVYPKKRLRYALAGERITLELELGDFDDTPGDLMGRLAAAAAAENLARQQSQQQL